MCDLTQKTDAIMDTVDAWDTVKVNKISAIVLKVEYESVPFRPLPVRARSVIPNETIHVGRTEESELTIPTDGRMSRRHFSLECREDHAIIRDLNSTNGTFVNGASVEEVKVYDGDRIVAGTTIFALQVIATDG